MGSWNRICWNVTTITCKTFDKSTAHILYFLSSFSWRENFKVLQAAQPVNAFLDMMKQLGLSSYFQPVQQPSGTDQGKSLNTTTTTTPSIYVVDWKLFCPNLFDNIPTMTNNCNKTESSTSNRQLSSPNANRMQNMLSAIQQVQDGATLCIKICPNDTFYINFAQGNTYHWKSLIKNCEINLLNQLYLSPNPQTCKYRTSAWNKLWWQSGCDRYPDSGNVRRTSPRSHSIPIPAGLSGWGSSHWGWHERIESTQTFTTQSTECLITKTEA